MALLEVTYFSNSLSMSVNMNVILPEKTKGQIGMSGKGEGKCKTLYLLHGMSDDHTIWERRTSIERYAAQYNLAVVMPMAGLSWYTDMAHGLPYFTFIQDELPQICRSMFPQISGRREDTFAAGLSMGGYGALKLGLRKSENYAAVAALSSGADVFDMIDNAAADRLSYWEDVFGAKEAFIGSENDLFSAAKELKASGKKPPRIYMWCGTEDRLFAGNLRMRDHLNALGFEVSWEQSPGGHSWEKWDEKIKTVLSFLCEERRD